METNVSGSQILKDLQGQSNCPKYSNLPDQGQWAISVEVAERIGFSADGVKQGHASMTFDGSHPSEAKMSVIASSRGSALLFGTVGSGKTAMLSAMLKDKFSDWAMKTHCKVYILPTFFCRQVIYSTHEDLNTLLLDEDSMIDMDYVTKSGLLIIDEFMGPPDTKSGWHMSKMEGLIDYRWRNGLDTWLAMNLDPEQIKNEQYFKKIFSRLTDKSWMSAFRWSGKDRRPNNS